MILSVLKRVSRPIIAFNNYPCFNFAKLPTNLPSFAESKVEYPYEAYYENILRVSKVSPTGRMSVRPELMQNFVEKYE